MTLMLAPKASTTYIVSSGKNYTADLNSLIYNVVQGQDVLDLQSAGAIVLQPPPSNRIGILTQANLNSTSDQAFSMLISNKFRVTKVTAENTSLNSPATAAGGIYPAVGKGGTTIVAATQLYTGMSAANVALDLTLANPNIIYPAGTILYLSLTTPQGAAITCDIYAFGDIYP